MKEKILKCLREAEDYVSGQELCQMFDVSRTAIWKVMNQLKEEGYVIDAVKNKGYRLVQTPDLVTAEEVKVSLRHHGRHGRLSMKKNRHRLIRQLRCWQNRGLRMEHLWSLSVRYPAEAEEAVLGIRQRAAASG